MLLFCYFLTPSTPISSGFFFCSFFLSLTNTLLFYPTFLKKYCIEDINPVFFKKKQNCRIIGIPWREGKPHIIRHGELKSINLIHLNEKERLSFFFSLSYVNYCIYRRRRRNSSSSSNSDRSKIISLGLISIIEQLVS